MDWDVEKLSKSEVSKLLHSTVVPRPIALVTTLDAKGRVNAAPFSFFNVMSTTPALLALGVTGNEKVAGEPKDTRRNVTASGELVVSLVDESMVHQMNVCGIEFPGGVEEPQMAGLQLLPSVRVAPPRIAISPVQFECKLHTQIPTGPSGAILICEIVHIHVRNELANERFHIDIEKLALIARMHGNGWYARTSDLFQVERIPLEKWPIAPPERPA